MFFQSEERKVDIVYHMHDIQVVFGSPFKDNTNTWLSALCLIVTYVQTSMQAQTIHHFQTLVNIGINKLCKTYNSFK